MTLMDLRIDLSKSWFPSVYTWHDTRDERLERAGEQFHDVIFFSLITMIPRLGRCILVRPRGVSGCKGDERECRLVTV